MKQESGYALLAVVIILVIMGIFMGMAVPVWQTVMQREKEEELIWRGKQYVRAIGLYQRKHPGAFPPTVEILVEQKFLRQEYEDPMSEDGKWKIIRQLSPEARGIMGGGAAGPGAGRRGGRGARGGRGGPEDQGEQPGARGRQAGQRPGMPGQRSRLGGGDEQGLGGIVGVASKSEEESIRVYEGKEKYSEWVFVYAPQAGAPGTRPPGAPGLPGRRGGQPGQPGGGPGLGPGQRQRPGQGPGQQQRPGQGPGSQQRRPQGNPQQ